MFNLVTGPVILSIPKAVTLTFLAGVCSQCELVLSRVVSLLYIPHNADIKGEFVKFLWFDSISSLVCYIGCV